MSACSSALLFSALCAEKFPRCFADCFSFSKEPLSSSLLERLSFQHSAEFSRTAVIKRQNETRLNKIIKLTIKAKKITKNEVYTICFC